jgi:hypothetical protein
MDRKGNKINGCCICSFGLVPVHPRKEIGIDPSVTGRVSMSDSLKAGIERLLKLAGVRKRLAVATQLARVDHLMPLDTHSTCVRLELIGASTIFSPVPATV